MSLFSAAAFQAARGKGELREHVFGAEVSGFRRCEFYCKWYSRQDLTDLTDSSKLLRTGCERGPIEHDSFDKQVHGGSDLLGASRGDAQRTELDITFPGESQALAAGYKNLDVRALHKQALRETGCLLNDMLAAVQDQEHLL